MKFKTEKAITLIALIITIIILVILVAVSIRAVANNGIVGQAVNGSQDYAKASKDEERMYNSVTGLIDSTLSNLSNYSGSSSGGGNGGGSSASTFAQAKAVGSYEYATDTDESVKYYSPDLTGFNGMQTYYVVYDSNGNMTVPGRCDLMEPSDVTGWYDYENKKWANIVTVNDNSITFWVWIPRFAYYVNGSTEEVYFVDTDNNCTLKVEGTETTYTANTSNTNTVTINEKTYTLSDAFTFDEKDLKGYWISKYEVQYEQNRNRVLTQVSGNKIKIDLLERGTGPYLLYVNGVKQNGQITEFPAEITADTSKENDIMLIDTSTEMILTAVNDNVKIDLSGFSTSCTYYVEYDETTGEEKTGDKTLIRVNTDGTPANAPENWYDYSHKKWANIVTKGKDENGNELITYWTYIPRYEYRVINNQLDISFISVGTTAHQGYQIPDSFTFDGEPLNGYWISKYEVQKLD